MPVTRYGMAVSRCVHLPVASYPDCCPYFHLTLLPYTYTFYLLPSIHLTPYTLHHIPSTFQLPLTIPEPLFTKLFFNIASASFICIGSFSRFLGPWPCLF